MIKNIDTMNEEIFLIDDIVDNRCAIDIELSTIDENYWKDCHLRKLMKIILRILKRKTENLNLENNL